MFQAIVDKYPGRLALDESGAGESGGSPRLAVAGEDEQGVLSTLNATLQPQQPFTDLSDPEQETRLVTSARLQMARSRQQLLASMVLLGINRIVVTDGAINAKVVFDPKPADQAQRQINAGNRSRDSHIGSVHLDRGR